MEKEKALIIVALILLILNVYQYISYTNLKELYINYKEKAEADIEKLVLEKKNLTYELQNSIYENQKLSEKNKNLENLYSQLNETYTKTVENYTFLNKEYQNLKDEAKTLLTKLDEYEEKINESMGWFSLNSNIENMNNSLKKSIQDDIKSECYRIVFDECRIKTACFYLVNDEFYGLRYLTDVSLYKKNDKLASLEEFLSNKGGDCEDYSLFYKAQINYVLGKCKDKRIVLESYFPSENGARYFVNFRETWFIRDVEVKELEQGNTYPYVVCYLTEPSLGHCVVAFSRYKINSSDQIYLLDGAELIEPQDGSYLGEIGKEIRLPVNPNQINELMIVINNNDLYSFDENGWTGYQDFKTRINEMRNELLLYFK